MRRVTARVGRAVARAAGCCTLACLVAACGPGLGGGLGTSVSGVDATIPKVVVAGAPATLTWRFLRDGAPPDDAVVDCRIDAGDGRPVVEIEDCGVAGSHEFVYAAPVDTAIAQLMVSLHARERRDGLPAEAGWAGLSSSTYLVPDSGEEAFFVVTPRPAGGTAPLTVEFEARAVYVGPLGPAQPMTCMLLFDVDDPGAGGVGWRPCNEGPPTTYRPTDDLRHTYTEPGTYTARLFGWDPADGRVMYPGVLVVIDVE